jgi:hypothetical protein
MKPNEILIVPKRTKLTLDMHRLGFPEETLKVFYEKEGLHAERIIASHKRQKAALDKLKSLLPGARVIWREEISKDIINKASLVIAFGGDNHFQYVSHFVEDTPILGINSDPQRSEGALTSLNIEEFEKILPLILNDELKLEEWTRLEAYIDGKRVLEQSIAEIFIGEKKRFQMSRHVLNINDNSEEQKGSGLLVTTGSGSTGWYNSASRYMFPEGNHFKRTEKEARFILAEPYRGKLTNPKIPHGTITGNQKIELTILSDDEPVLVIDAHKVVNLREGAKVTVKLGKPLKVVRV